MVPEDSGDKSMKRALIAMSGGVDSSVAAMLMKDRGFHCIGCTMKLYHNEDVGLERGRTCCSLDDVEDARSVARRLQMPYYVFNFSYDFREQVMDRFAAAYEAGMTPNPCIDCNRCMKFEKLYHRAEILGCDSVVTGHYARIEREGENYQLKKALDETKDQSYVLYFMNQEQLAHTIFPLGSLRKTQVRALAEENGFLNAHKADSQDICFVPDGDYASFLERYRGKTYAPGAFLNENGDVLGQHRGIIHYTVGQRKGLGVSFGEPMYVKCINAAENTVTLCKERDLYGRTVWADRFHWISGKKPNGTLRCKVRIRYRQPEQEALVSPTDDASVRIVFEQPQRAITPGQAAVLYDGDTVLGGGTIVYSE